MRTSFFRDLIALWLLLSFTLFSCEQDDYEFPEPISYRFNIPNKVSFIFKQQSMLSNNIIPYSNSLDIINISDNVLSGNYVLFSFLNEQQSYNNLEFIKRGHLDNIQPNDTLKGVVLQESNALFSDNNLTSAILNFNNEITNHPLNGYYSGVINLLEDDESSITFLRTLNCIGYIDYLGHFEFFTINNDESLIARLRGNFNTDNSVFGNIIQNNGMTLSSLENVDNSILQLNMTNLSGDLSYTENSQEFILRFNLNQQN